MNASPVLMCCLVLGCLATQPVVAASTHAKIAVTSQDDGSISEIDPDSGRIVARVVVARGPAALASSTDGREIFVTHPDAAIVDVVDVARARVVRTWSYAGQPFGIAAGRGVVFVSDWTNNVVVRLDAQTGEPTGSVAVGKSPAGLTIDLRRHRLYVADRESGDVAVIDTERFGRVATLKTGAAPFALALAPDGARLYVANVRSNDLAVIDTNDLRRIATVPVGPMPYGVAVTAGGRTILVTNQHGNTLTLIDAKTLGVLMTLPVGRYPEGVIATDGRAYVANWFSGDVSVIDLTRFREITRIKVGDGPRGLTFLSNSDGAP